MFLTWLGAILVGLSLGILGSGGSILTVPVLIYLAEQNEKVAIAESLAIVGVIALAGGISGLRAAEVRWRHVLLFGIPGMVGSYIGAQAAVMVPAAVQLLLFGTILIAAAGLMMRPAAEERAEPAEPVLLGFYGFGVGVITGLVGVGGGFLIVPALTILGGLPMRSAVACSLWIIALTSGTGFWKYGTVLEGLGLSVDWKLVGGFAALGVCGAVLGNRMSRRLPQERLRRFFAVFLILIGAFVLATNVPRLL